jgi:hypothetical protein
MPVTSAKWAPPQGPTCACLPRRFDSDSEIEEALRALLAAADQVRKTG